MRLIIDPYVIVEFTDSSNNSLGRYSIVDSVSDATAVRSGYDESSNNTFYYGCTQNSDSTVTSTWNSAPTTGIISPSKLYLDSLTFIVDDSLTPTITIGDGSAQTVSADASDIQNIFRGCFISFYLYGYNYFSFI